jgi:hypothetical protein
LASIAIPIDSISQAIEARVRTVWNNLTKNNNKITYTNNAKDAITQLSPYTNIKNTKINKNPIIQDTKSLFKE